MSRFLIVPITPLLTRALLWTLGLQHRGAICTKMGGVRNLNRGQRVVAVIGWSAILWFVGSFLSTLGEPGASGWVAYAPLSRAVLSPGLDLTPLEDLFLWLALAVVWVVGAMLLLRTQDPTKDGDTEV